MLLIFLLCIVALILCHKTLSKRFMYWKKRGVPNPPVSVLFGNLKDVVFMKKSLSKISHDIYNQFPSLPYVGYYQMGKPAIVVRDPELIKNIFTTSFSHFANNDLDVHPLNDPLIAKNPFFCNGVQWKTSRSQLTPSFTSKQMKDNFILMQLVCHKLIKFLENPVIANGGIETKELCQKYTMEVVALCAMGLEAHSFESKNTDFITAARKIFSPSFFTSIRLMIVFLAPSLAKFVKAKFIPDDVGNYFKKIINETMEYRKSNKTVKRDFLNTMIELQTKVGEDKLSNSDVTGHALSFFTDGFETSSIAISFLLYELGANVNIQERLRLEIEQKLEKEQREIDYEFVQELVYLNNVINESLRLHVPILVLGKRCTQEFELPPLTTDGKSVVIKPGTPITIPVYSIHHDKKFFSEPREFNPDRFSDNDDIKKGIFLPFGDGPRACIGQRFAMAQIKAAVVYILLNFDIRVNNKTITPIALDPMHFIAIPKGGLWLNFIKRENVH